MPQNVFFSAVWSGDEKEKERKEDEKEQILEEKEYESASTRVGVEVIFGAGPELVRVSYMYHGTVSQTCFFFSFVRFFKHRSDFASNY